MGNKNRHSNKDPRWTHVYEEKGEFYWYAISHDDWNWRLQFLGMVDNGKNRSKVKSLTYHATPPQLVYRLFDLLVRIEVSPSKSLKDFERGVTRAYQLVKKSTESIL